MTDQIKVALAGQQNAGKSTLFNLLTGARQHVANYPGVTVDKKYGSYKFEGVSVTAVDLPGTYSLTSFSLEERVARAFLIQERPDVAVNVVDASNLRRSLHLTIQLLEMGLKSVLALNMMDIATKRGISIDVKGLARKLGLTVVETIGSKGFGRENLRQAILEEARCAKHDVQCIDYASLEPLISDLSLMVRDPASEWHLPARWLAIKLLEQDSQTQTLLQESAGFEWADNIIQKANQMAEQFEQTEGMSTSDSIIATRDRYITELLADCVTDTEKETESTTSKIDRFVLNRWAAPLFLVLTVYLIYQISIVWGYELTNYTWPILAKFREIVANLLPSAGFLEDPYTRSMGLWLVDSANTLLNYVPIFIILFALIAMLEDSGYMARIAFILDKVLHRFGLHGQSTLPLILGGVFAGGCAVPGIMATKGIPDNRARMATIFAVPFMNCLAKVPLYTLLLGIFFVEDKSLMMFYISTMTVIFALLVSKLLTVTVLKGQETSPFVMELPTYHVPTVKAVLQRSFERTWIYIKKVGTIVVAVAVVVFALLQFPGLSDDHMQQYEANGVKAVEKFQKSMKGNAYEALASNENIVPLVNYYTDYKRAKLNAGGAAGSKAVNETFMARNADYYPLVRAPKGDKDAKKAGRALKKLVKTRKSIRREMKEERITTSVLGMIGRSLEPVTQFAGFDWKINVALLSSFAARESSVATLGVLFQQDEDQNATLEDRMGAETKAGGATALLAVSMILFFALYPPCLATTVMVKVQTGSYKWMLFSILFPTALGLSVSSAVYTIGTAAGLGGMQMMTIVYLSALALLVIVGLYSGRHERSLDVLLEQRSKVAEKGA
nr:ferrous iron transport protein B [uncultured Cohaesibacter sp.]